MPTPIIREAVESDPFLVEHPDKAIPNLTASAKVRRQSTTETTNQAREALVPEATEEEFELPEPNADGVIETEAFTFIPDTIAAAAETIETDEDPILGVDQYGEPVRESEYLANPDAFEYEPEPTIAAAATSTPESNTTIQDSVIGVDEDGKPVYASEYFANPDAFSVETQVPTTVPDPIIAVTADGRPVTASEYYTNPSAFVVKKS